MKRKIELCGRTVEYDLQRKKVKNINLRVKPDLSVCVSANSTVGLSVIESFLMSNAERIIAALDKFAAAAAEAGPPKSYVSGEIHQLFGKDHELFVERGRFDCVVWRGDQLILTVTDPSDTDKKRRTLDEWKAGLCADLIRELCEKVYPTFRAYGVPFPQLRFREMKSRWGSCRPERGILTFNTKLSDVPPEAIEYVVVHEFVHFLEPDHSRRFYDRLSSIMPDWKLRRDMLSRRTP